MSQNNCCVMVVGAILAIGVLLIVILIPISFKGVEYYEYGFKRQKSTGKVKTDEVYSGGKHFIGPDYEFKTFKSTAHYIDLDLSVFTSDKLSINIDVYFQFFIRKDDLSILFKKYDINYEATVRKNAVAELKADAMKFSTWQFITDRAAVEEDLFKGIRNRLGGPCCASDCTEWKMACPEDCFNNSMCNYETDSGYYVDVKYFQLGQVTIDSDVEERYLRSLTLVEENEQEKLKQEAQVLRKATVAKVKNIENEAKEIRQKAQSQSQLINTVSKANYTVTLEKARSEGLKALYNKLNINDQSVKNSFDYLRTLRSLDHIHFTVDFQQRIVGGLN